jgi:large subunit ribosomal protein L25
MVDDQTLALQERILFGKRLKRLRLQGVTPVHVYGKGMDSLSLQGATEDVRSLISGYSLGSDVKLKVQGKRTALKAGIDKVSRHPLTGQILHIDFLCR